VSQKRKVTLYFNAAMLAETQKEALRQDRSISWIMPPALSATTAAAPATTAATAPAGEGRPIVRGDA
jgi:uncharacterized small protein (TIGR04563 family)